MLITIRSPFGLAIAAALLAAFLAFGLTRLGDKAEQAATANDKVRQIRAESAPLLASDLIQYQERRRREGQPYAANTAELVDGWLVQFGERNREQMLDWIAYHDATGGAGSYRAWAETSSGPGTDGWFRVEVDRAARTVEATCGGSPAPGCVAGRWSVEEFGLSDSYLLGR
jgi:hypothetical protein